MRKMSRRNTCRTKMKSLFLFMLLSMANLCSAAVVTVSLTWSGNLSSYNLQEGSIVQIVAYDHRDASKPPSTAAGNFEEISPNIYNPETFSDEHFMVYETYIAGNSINVSFNMSGFTRIYIRVFEQTSFEEESLSNWGLSSIRNIPQNGHPWSTAWANVSAGRENTFSTGVYFEVIPEPTTLWLALFGAVCIILRHERRILLFLRRRD